MISMLRIAESLILDRLISGQAPLTHKSKFALGMSIIAIFLMVCATGFFVYAAYLWLSLQYEPHVTAVLSGAFALIIVIIMGIGTGLFAMYKKSRIKRFRESVTNDLQDMVANLADELDIGEYIRENPKTTLGLATLAGYIIAEKVL